MKITEQTTLEELSGLFPEAEGKLISGGDFFTAKKELTLAKLQKEQPTWNVNDIIYGLERLKEIREKGYYVIDVYPDSDESRKANVGLMKMTAGA